MKRWLALVTLLGVVGAAPPPGLARTYVIDSLASRVVVVLKRAGPLAVLAHDHVLVARGMAGQINWEPDRPAEASVQVTIPVGSLEVDAPEARAAAGLSGTLSESNRASVRKNLLAEDQLDEAGHPRIVVTLVGLSGAPPQVQAHLRVRIRQAERTVSVPVRVVFEEGTLRAEGQVELVQSDFGIEPYSTLLGAIAVQDRVRVNFRFVARPLS